MRVDRGLTRREVNVFFSSCSVGWILFTEDPFQWGNTVKSLQIFSAYFDGCGRGVSWVIGRSLKVRWSLVFSEPVGRLCMVDVTIKDKVFCFMVNRPTASSEPPNFPTSSHRLLETMTTDLSVLQLSWIRLRLGSLVTGNSTHPS